MTTLYTKLIGRYELLLVAGRVADLFGCFHVTDRGEVRLDYIIKVGDSKRKYANLDAACQEMERLEPKSKSESLTGFTGQNPRYVG